MVNVKMGVFNVLHTIAYSLNLLWIYTIDSFLNTFYRYLILQEVDI